MDDLILFFVGVFGDIFTDLSSMFVSSGVSILAIIAGAFIIYLVLNNFLMRVR